MHISNECGNCAAQTRSRRREFTDQIWSVLITWGEVDRSLVDNPICDDCYNEFREVLIDRAKELELALADPVKYHEMVKAEQEKAKKANAKKVSEAKTEKKKVSSKKKKVAATAKKATKKKAAQKPAKKAAKKKAKTTKKKTRKVGKMAS